VKLSEEEFQNSTFLANILTSGDFESESRCLVDMLT